jgi:hypothetical protein
MPTVMNSPQPVFSVIQENPPTAVSENAPPARARLDVGPVPFRSELRLSLTLPRAEEASVDVYDVQGRLVRRLLHRSLPAGSHRLLWDGRTGGGARAPAGIYFLRYAGGGAAELRRVVLLK